MLLSFSSTPQNHNYTHCLVQLLDWRVKANIWVEAAAQGLKATGEDDGRVLLRSMGVQVSG